MRRAWAGAALDGHRSIIAAVVSPYHPAVMEVAPGIHRIEGDLGERYVCQYLLVGEERTLLVDTGLRDMPEQVIAPYLADLAGRSPTSTTC